MSHPDSHGGQSALEMQITDSFDSYWPHKYSIADVIVWERTFRGHDPESFATAIAKWRAGPKGHFPPKPVEIAKLMPPLPASAQAEIPPNVIETDRLESYRETKRSEKEQAEIDAVVSRLSDDEYRVYAQAAIDKVHEDIKGLYEKMLLAGKGRKIQSIKEGVYRLMK